MVPSYPLEDLRERLFDQVRPWQRLFQFWVRTVDIYTGYKVFVKDAKKREELWERQHEHACS
ncbi:hypothetical protein Syun_020330 [Stephania yunnanensis]|uniref:Uncharacterized protein n=1 Tax=Stephania yunnanensis TaxID=152371 RepID=A0AAP0IDR4_9MAGN